MANGGNTENAGTKELDHVLYGDYDVRVQGCCSIYHLWRAARHMYYHTRDCMLTDGLMRLTSGASGLAFHGLCISKAGARDRRRKMCAMGASMSGLACQREQATVVTLRQP